jgi:hypothetical protein
MATGCTGWRGRSDGAVQGLVGVGVHAQGDAQVGVFGQGRHWGQSNYPHYCSGRTGRQEGCGERARAEVGFPSFVCFVVIQLPVPRIHHEGREGHDDPGGGGRRGNREAILAVPHSTALRHTRGASPQPYGVCRRRVGRPGRGASLAGVGDGLPRVVPPARTDGRTGGQADGVSQSRQSAAPLVGGRSTRCILF